MIRLAKEIITLNLVSIINAVGMEILQRLVDLILIVLIIWNIKHVVMDNVNNQLHVKLSILILFIIVHSIAHLAQQIKRI